MRKTTRLLPLLLLVNLFLPQSLLAAGLGFYGTAGAGSSYWSIYDIYSSDSTFTKSTNHLGFGLALDTAPSRNKLFNYELNIGYDRFTLKNAGAWGSADLKGLMLSNNFGFGALINPTTRLWFGPEIRVTWVDGAPRSYPDYHLRLFGFGIGAVMGLNMNYESDQTVVVKAGYQYISYIGEGDGYFDHTTNARSIYSQSKDYDITERLFYMTVEFLIRTAEDRY